MSRNASSLARAHGHPYNTPKPSLWFRGLKWFRCYATRRTAWHRPCKVRLNIERRSIKHRRRGATNKCLSLNIRSFNRECYCLMFAPTEGRGFCQRFAFKLVPAFFFLLSSLLCCRPELHQT